MIGVPGVHIDGDRRIYLLNFDKQTGTLAFDLNWRDEVLKKVGVNFSRTSWPHGKTGPARPHGLMFVD